jgi:hypothetical protein
MSLQEGQPARAEFVPEDEIFDLQDANDHLMAAYLQERSHVLRAGVFLKLSEYFDVQGLVGGWAIFSPNNEQQAGGGVASLSAGDKEILVLLVPTTGIESIEGNDVPTIRIITNEYYQGQNGRSQMLTTDFSLDSDNDAWYSIDAIERGQKIDTTSSPVFYVNEDGDLCLTNNASVSFTQLSSFEPTDPPAGESADPWHPLGSYESDLDTVHALQVGQALFDEVINLEPTHYSPMPEAGLA